ncbi:MAG: repressor LexA [Deltaproteobacteria bacterium]|nr:repressor LexA [Deltaproteobacteria bacterium]
MCKLTERRRKVLDFVRGYVEAKGYPPSIREIASHLGVSGTLGVVKHLKALEREGYVRRAPRRSRGLSLTDAAPTPSTPIVGTVRAGMPQPAIEEIQGYFSIEHFHSPKKGTFFLRVTGESMIEAHIQDGDLALINPQPMAEDRDIVVALMDGEATLKRFYKEGNRIRLQPENPSMQPIFVQPGEGEVMILGKVVGVFREIH